MKIYLLPLAFCLILFSCNKKSETEKVVEDVTEPEHHRDKESKIKELKKKLKPTKESKP